MLRRRTVITAVALATATALVASTTTRDARAEDVPTPEAREEAGERLPPAIRELRRDPAISAGVIVSALSLSFVVEVGKPWIAPAVCGWCDRAPDGSSSLGGLDQRTRRALVWDRPRLAGRLSDAAGLLVAPATAFALLALVGAREDASPAFPVDGMIVLEASSLAVAATQVIKVAAARTRPFAHARDLDEVRPRPLTRDENLSFPSGHTSMAMSLATASGTVASMRGYGGAPLVWAAGLPLAFFTGYLRIAADRHYLTDVLAGALLGAASGVLVPLVFHPPRDGL